jgi:hypothetical protein
MKWILFILGLLALAGLFSCNKSTLNAGNNFTCTVYAIAATGDTVAVQTHQYNNYPYSAQTLEDSLKTFDPSGDLVINCY